MAPLRVVVVNGSPNAQSTTMGLARVALATLSKSVVIDAHHVDVYRLGSGFTGATSRQDVDSSVDAELRGAEQSDLLIAATPIYQGSYTGMFKHFFDLIDRYALATKPVLLLATGGGERDALALDYALRPLFASLQARTLPVGVYAASGDFDGNTLLNPRVHGRVAIALDDLVRTSGPRDSV